MRAMVRAGLPAVAALVAVLALGTSSTGAVVPTHALNLCQSASFYENYDSARGPYNLKRVLGYADKIGHTPGAHPVYNGWAATFDFGPNDWGFMRIECIGAYNSW